MILKVASAAVLGIGLLVAGLSCIDEGPTGPTAPGTFYPANPGAKWTYQYVLGDSARYWSIQMRDERTVLAGDSVWALDYYADGSVTLTVFIVEEDGLVYTAGRREISWADTLLEIYSPPLLYSPRGTGPGETWSSVASVRYLKIAPSTPPDTLETEGYLAWTGRVLGEERFKVPAFDEPVRTLKVEFYGEADPWSPPEMHQYVWFAENVGDVRSIDLTFGGRTVNNLFEFVQGKK